MLVKIKEEVNHMNNIRYLRQKNNLTQVELAAKMGVKQNTLSAWETGSSTPELRSAVRLADFFEVSLDFLLGRSSA